MKDDIETLIKDNDKLRKIVKKQENFIKNLKLDLKKET